jgi:hypothetical protein
VWCLDSRRGGARWSAPVSFGRWRRRARWGGSELHPGDCEGGGGRGGIGRPKDAHARQVARLAGPRRNGRGACQARQRAHDAARPAAARAGSWERECGPGHDGRCVAHAVMAYGRWAVWAQRGCWRDVTRRARSSVPARFQIALAPFDRFKIKNFEPKFKFSKYESCRPDNPLQLS